MLEQFKDTQASSQQQGSNIPEFVKKLFGMLEDNLYPHIFSWGAKGDTFVVKDPNEFSRHILPKHFKHSNFASFVRQLNKYDFHKLRLPDDGQRRLYGNQAWEFKHPNFKYNRRELLEDIKRKPPGKQQQQQGSTKDELTLLAKNLQKEISELKDSQHKLVNQINTFDKKYNTVLDHMDSFKKNMADQDTLMKDIVQFISNNNNNDVNLKDIINTYQSLSNTNEIQLDNIIQQQATMMPTIIQQQQQSLVMMPQQQQQQPIITKKRKRAWTIPPRVLLVDDDSIFRRLSTRLLQLAGCTIDVAVDGVEAIRKLGTDKYDLVLMDIMMPKLDGMSATRNIRQYDTWTPIISMTSNTTDQDIQQYFMSGMTDVLAKPFNQGALGSLLERYCAHLVIQRSYHQPQLTLLEEDQDNQPPNKKRYTNNSSNISSFL